MKIVPNALYAGRDPDTQDESLDGQTLDEQLLQDAKRKSTESSEKEKGA
jgi:hypothetical protein